MYVIRSAHRASWPHGMAYFIIVCFKQNVCLIRYYVFRSPVRRYLQLFLSLYRASREITKVCLQIIFGYGSETSLLAWVRENTRR